MTIDFKKTDKNLYLPKDKPMIIDVPEMLFIMIDGKGDPNNNQSYNEAVEILYGLSYTIKMSIKKGINIPGFYDYVVPPLEGLWWIEEGEFDLKFRDNWLWTSMIRQPEFVTQDVFQWAVDSFHKKKPDLQVERAKLKTFSEGLCVQMMHIGLYADEPVTLEIMKEFMYSNNLVDETGNKRKHHEIYLSDPNKTEPNSLKTVLRHPVVKK